MHSDKTARWRESLGWFKSVGQKLSWEGFGDVYTRMKRKQWFIIIFSQGLIYSSDSDFWNSGCKNNWPGSPPCASSQTLLFPTYLESLVGGTPLHWFGIQPRNLGKAFWMLIQIASVLSSNAEPGKVLLHVDDRPVALKLVRLLLMALDTRGREDVSFQGDYFLLLHIWISYLESFWAVFWVVKVFVNIQSSAMHDLIAWPLGAHTWKDVPQILLN